MHYALCIVNYEFCIVNYSSPTQLAPLTLASLSQVSEACISLVSIVLSSHGEGLHGFNYFSTGRTEQPPSRLTGSSRIVLFESNSRQYARSS